MANLDTRSKRASSVQVLLPFLAAPVLPDGTLSQGDRQHIAWAYSGILASGAVVVVETPGGGVPSIRPEIEAWRLAYVRHRRRRLTLPRGV